MRTGHVDRLWMIGGAVAAALLIVVGWFALISPQHGKAGGLRDQTADQETKVASLRQRLDELRQQSGRFAEFQANLTTAQKALPDNAALPDFLRELQAAGGNTSVAVSGIAVGSPSAPTATGPKAYTLPITLTANGSAKDLDRFLNQIQQVQPRAALVLSANSVPDGPGTLAGKVDMAVGLWLFVTGTPSTTSKTN